MKPVAVRALRALLVVLPCLLAAASVPARVEAPSSDVPRHFGRDRLVDIEHLRLELFVDVKEQRIEGNAQLTVRGLADGTTRAEFDAVDFENVRVSIDGKAAAQDYDGRMLVVTFDPPLGDGVEGLVRVDYSAKPRNGLHFVKPDRAYPEKGFEAWSQGEDEDNRFWFPVHDSPNERLTSETLITVEAPFSCVSNGKLVSVTDAPGGRRTFHHVMDFAHVPYLVSIAVGDWATTRSEWEGIELTTHVPRAFADRAERSFANTARILAFISKDTGVKYPYPAYRQTCVTDFMHGGMENIAATTLLVETLHEERAHVDWPSESLVAHEAAHQWFGDYVTCRDWSDIWLNEGAATYWAALAMGDVFGPEQLVSELDGMHSSAISADAGAARRPVVTNTYRGLFELFDGHAYAKGGSVLHALRRELGDVAFRKAIRTHLETNAGRSVDTHDFIAAVETSTGRDVSRFFDQWIYGAGQPELEVSWSWKAGRISLTVVQAQERSTLVGLFDLPLDVQVLGETFTLDREIRVTAERETFHFDCAERPQAVVIDPQGWQLRKLKIDRPDSEAAWVLRHAPLLLPRLEAARNLAESAGQPEALPALTELLQDGANPWPLRREVAATLAKARSVRGRAALLAGLTLDGDSRVRSRVAESLGEHEAEFVGEPLKRALSSDGSWAVRAAAARALGKARVKGAESVLERALAQPSHRDEVARGALAGLEELKAPRLRAIAERLSAQGRPTRTRGDALQVLARLGADSDDKRLVKEIREKLVLVLDDPIHRAQRSAAEALGVLGDQEALPILKRLAASADQSPLRRTAQDAVKALEARRDQGAKVAALSRQVADEKQAREELEKKLRSLEARVDEALPKPADEALPKAGDDEPAKAP